MPTNENDHRMLARRRQELSRLPRGWKFQAADLHLHCQGQLQVPVARRSSRM
jgi:hypothetical protein